MSEVESPFAGLRILAAVDRLGVEGQRIYLKTNFFAGWLLQDLPWKGEPFAEPLSACCQAIRLSGNDDVGGICSRCLQPLTVFKRTSDTQDLQGYDPIGTAQVASAVLDPLVASLAAQDLGRLVEALLLHPEAWAALNDQNIQLDTVENLVAELGRL